MRPTFRRLGPALTIFGLAAAGGSLFAAPSASAWPVPRELAAFAESASGPVLPPGNIALADRLELLGQYAGALELYLRQPATVRNQPEIRARIQTCVRRVLQTARQHDAGYRSKVLALTFYQSVQEYGTVLGKLQANYVDRERVTPARLVRTGAQELDAALADEWFRQEFVPSATPKAVAAARSRLHDLAAHAEAADTAAAKAIVQQAALEIQHELGLEPTVSVMEFACGACNALDEFSAYLPPGQDDDLSLPGGELDVLGLQFGFTDGQLVVARITAGSPAALAGLRAGDRVLRLNGRALAGLSRSAVADQLRSDESSALEMDALSTENGMVRPVRLPLDLPAVTDVRVGPDGVGYLRLTGFTRLAAQELDEAILSMKMRGLRALVIDLRGNTGGLFAAAVQIAERFIADGLIVETRGRAKGASQPYYAGGGMTADVPLVVLVDGETASAAEVLAGALKDRGRAELVGVPTYGKATIQAVLPLKSIGALRLTLARFFPPSGRSFQGLGIAPTYEDADPDRQLELATTRARALAGRP